MPKNRGGQTYFAPLSVRLEEAPPPQIDAYGSIQCSSINRAVLYRSKACSCGDSGLPDSGIVMDFFFFFDVLERP